MLIKNLADYEEEEFQLMWKANDRAVARYDNGEVMFYHGSPYQQDRANITADFDGKFLVFSKEPFITDRKPY